MKQNEAVAAAAKAGGIRFSIDDDEAAQVRLCSLSFHVCLCFGWTSKIFRNVPMINEDDRDVKRFTKRIVR